MAIGEFDLIDSYFRWSGTAEGLIHGIGDDAALIQCDNPIAASCAAWRLTEGAHAPCGDELASSLVENLRDSLHVHSAELRWMFLSLTLDAYNSEWLDRFARSLEAASRSHGAVLAGGDTTRGPLAIDLFGFGAVATR